MLNRIIQQTSDLTVGREVQYRSHATTTHTYRLALDILLANRCCCMGINILNSISRFHFFV